MWKSMIRMERSILNEELIMQAFTNTSLFTKVINCMKLDNLSFMQFFMAVLLNMIMNKMTSLYGVNTGADEI